jgi:hypothetical protein
MGRHESTSHPESSMSTAPNPQDPYVNLTSDQARDYLLLDLARRFKGTDPEVDARLDAHAETITGRPGIKFIPPVAKGEPRVPFYMEGEPGVGKTAIPRSAVAEFCKIAGLNYVESPPDGYEFDPKDFFFCTVNLSGKSNIMDMGGLPTKSEYASASSASMQAARARAADAGQWLLTEVESRIRAIAGYAKIGVSEVSKYDKGTLNGAELTVRSEDPLALDQMIQTVLRQLTDESKKRGVCVGVLGDGQEPQDGRLSLQIKKGAKGARISAFAPMVVDQAAEFVTEMLPNRRFAMATKVKFALYNFDDVANASESVRNVLLEVAQSNRYSGVMDIGNAYVTFSGNMGAEDNTNTQSEQSDAEVTRVFKVRVRDTPKDWAQRAAKKYNEAGDCLFSAFIHKHGNEDGVFRDAIGDARTARGIPKPNSRSLENALAKTLPYWQMAKASGISPTVFADDIERMIKGTAGANVATRYRAFMQAMLTEAIPLADQLLQSGKLDKERLDRNLGNGTRPAEQDFGFRFGAALADAFIERIAFSPEAEAAIAPEVTSKLISESMDRMCTGLAYLDPATMNYSLSRVMARMGAMSRMATDNGATVILNEETYEAMADGFAKSLVRKAWPDDQRAEKDFLSIVTGTNFVGNAKAKKSRAARP